jgi:hypothetical protein
MVARSAGENVFLILPHTDQFHIARHCRPPREVEHYNEGAMALHLASKRLKKHGFRETEASITNKLARAHSPPCSSWSALRR